MKFFQMVKDSVYNPGFYQDLKNQKFSDSVKYFAKFALIVSVVVALFPIVIGIGLLTWQSQRVADVRQQIVQTFPSELTLSIKNGEISTNVDEPYSIAIPDGIKNTVSQKQASYPLDNLLVINTHKQIETSDFQNYKTLAVLGKNEFGVLDPGRGKVEIQNLDRFAFNYTLDRSGFESLVNTIWKLAKILGFMLLILLPFIIFFGIFIGYMMYLLFGALVIWLAADLGKRSLSYKESYQAGLHLITLPIIGEFLLPFIFHIFFVFTLTLFILAYMNFKQIETATANSAKVV